MMLLVLDTEYICDYIHVLHIYNFFILLQTIFKSYLTTTIIKVQMNIILLNNVAIVSGICQAYLAILPPVMYIFIHKEHVVMKNSSLTYVNLN